MIDGYSIQEKIHQGRRRIVYRATRDSDRLPVVVKSLGIDLPNAADLAELRHEFEMLSSLQIEGVIKAHELILQHGSLHLVIEDRAGQTLGQLIHENSPPIRRRFQIATNIAKILEQVHVSHVTHRDVNPFNILVAPSTGDVTLIDFSIATHDRQETRETTGLEGTLAYMSPEQTGRMNRAVDYRTDFYSLGVTLFELFTGRLPFEAEDPMEFVHCHMAVQPPDSRSLNPDLPDSLSHLLRKLLAKDPEDRYQSAAGIAHDLQRCLEHIDTGVPDCFVVGAFDQASRLRIPEKLYGRASETRALLDVFDRVQRHGTEIALVAGYSGIGKSSLIDALRQPITDRGGWFISGKFDQLQRTIPYSAIADAFGSFARQILTGTNQQLTDWKHTIEEAVRGNGQIVIDVVPEIEHVIGSQPAAPELSGEEAKTRFRMVFGDFVRSLTRHEHPLVVFLDDLQWADPASLELVESIVTDTDTQHLLLIGAYRDNEVDQSHELTGTIEALEAVGAAVTRIPIGPLDEGDLRRLLAETLRMPEERFSPLLALLLDKTGGNPFFMRQFLGTLHEEGQLTFASDQNCWTWDIPAIEAMKITDNVVDLMVRRLSDLPETSLKTLRIASCLGSACDVSSLCMITSESEESIIQTLGPAIDSGLVFRDERISSRAIDGAPKAPSRIRFLHDRVQEAAYSLIDESARSRAHRLIGQQLRAQLDHTDLDDRLFEVVDHLNLGRSLITDNAELMDLARINLQAANKAIAATAYNAAQAYSAVGLACLNDPWHDDYELARDLSRAHADAAYLLGDLESSQAILKTILDSVHTAAEQAEVHRTLVIQHTLRGRYLDAATAGREGLALLGIDVPTENLSAALNTELSEYRASLSDRCVADLIQLPAMDSSEQLIAMQLLANLCPLGYIADPDLCRWASAKIVNLSLSHGNAPSSAFGYAFFGQMHASHLHEYERAFEFGSLAIALADELNDPTQGCRTRHVYCAFINHWWQPLRGFDSVNVRGFQVGLRSGELQFAGYHRYNRAICLFHLGTPLDVLIDDYAEWIQFGKRTRNEHVIDQIGAMRRVAEDLTGRTPTPGSFTDDGEDDRTFVDDLTSRSAQPALCHYEIAKSQALYMYGRLDEAQVCAETARSRLSFIAGHFSGAVHNFYESLILLAKSIESDQFDRYELVERNQQQLERWSDASPDNFRHKWLLVEAERNRVDGRTWDAARLFDEAIQEAARAGFAQEESLARERAGLFWLAMGLTKIGALYLSEAHRGYQLWGASRKAEMLAEEYSSVLDGAHLSPSGRSQSVPFFTLVSSTGAALDFASVMKASRTISAEIDIDELVKKLLHMAVESAGAQEGRLLLVTANELRQEASTASGDGTRCSPPLPIDEIDDIPLTVVNLAIRTKSTVAVADARSDGSFANDPAIRRRQPRSVLCVPIIHRGDPIGLLYLEHNLAPNAFTADRVQILQSLAAQAAISIQNARLYDEQARNERRLRDALNEVEQLKDKLQAENEYFREEIKTHHKFEEIIGESNAIQRVLHAIETVAPTEATALILGETGTGKELVARAIHNLSSRRSNAIVMVNCAALPSGLIESELFGHEKGAFTGALTQKTGRFELADGGTLFLDEIGDLPIELQAKLLRVLQEGAFERVGGTKTIRVDSRVLAATHRDLLQEVREGSFREDLYYRLNVFPVQIPPLRDRSEDVPLLVQHFAMHHARKLGREIKSVSKATMDALVAYSWPGNVRELQNVIERAVILCHGSQLDIGDWLPGRSGSTGESAILTLDDIQRRHITEVLGMTGWRVSGEQGAAKILGLKPTTLEARMKKLGITRAS